MRKLPKRLSRLLKEHRDRAWEAELGLALGALAERFDQWRAGNLTSADLDDEVHRYHNGTAREIWKRYATWEPDLALAKAVRLGVVTRESLPPDVLEHMAPLLDPKLWAQEGGD